MKEHSNVYKLGQHINDNLRMVYEAEQHTWYDGPSYNLKVERRRRMMAQWKSSPY